MVNMLLSSQLFDAIKIAGLIVLAIAAVLIFLSAFAGVWKLIVYSRYKRFNKQKVAVGMTGPQVAEKMLQGLGVADVKVEKLGFWKSLFVGNSYNPRKKAIRLRANIFDQTSLTSVAVASQKVAIAQRHSEGDKKITTRYVLMRMGYFAPFSLVPLILIGVLLDLVVWSNLGWCSIIFTVVAFVYFIFAFVIALLNLKIEKKACTTSLEYMKKSNVLTDDELEDAKLLYKTYITDYWIEMLYDTLFIVWELFKLIGRVLKRGKK